VRGKLKEEPDMEGVLAGIDPSRSPSDLINAAAAFWADGQPRDAARHVFAAVLLALDKSGALSIGVSKTNKQLAEELKRKAPKFLSSFKSVSNIFQIVWFGGKNLDEESFSECLRLGSLLVGEAGSEKR
ncbi:MAG: hypothetical protein LBC41_17605, partial [Clostridiales bacterium]|nr:hypothetical protein [Clostridiales bacterium]